jgi:Zn-dependent membrane protease YugP
LSLRNAYPRHVPQANHIGMYVEYLWLERPNTMIRNRRIRRTIAGLLIAVGLLLLALAPSVGAGLAFFALGFVLELIGLALEHRDRRG